MIISTAALVPRIRVRKRFIGNIFLQSYEVELWLSQLSLRVGKVRALLGQTGSSVSIPSTLPARSFTRFLSSTISTLSASVFGLGGGQPSLSSCRHRCSRAGRQASRGIARGKRSAEKHYWTGELKLTATTSAGVRASKQKTRRRRTNSAAAAGGKERGGAGCWKDGSRFFLTSLH